MKRQITRVVIENYRSIRHCDVRLGPLTLLVGPNGSGKSNFLDALSFVADCMHAPFDQVLSTRAGFSFLPHQGPTGAARPDFVITVHLRLEDGHTAIYSLRWEWKPFSELGVSEFCKLSSGHEFTVQEGQIVKSTVSAPALTGDRPALCAFGGHEAFASIFRLLSEMRFYDPDVAAIRLARRLAAPKYLARNAENLADVLATRAGDRIKGYLAAVLPQLEDVTVRPYGDELRELQFKLAHYGRSGHIFNATQMSDGTLRSLALITALLQHSLPLRPASLVGLEEPENHLHPAAAGVLLDAMLEASTDVQVIATTHSADLLDHPELPPDVILTVEMDGGESILSSLGEATREIIRRKLYTPGELLRNRQLSPEPTNMHE